MKIHLPTLTVAALMALNFSGCEALTGKEVARLSFHAFSTENNLRSQEAALTLKAQDKVSIWSNMDMEYDGDPRLRFQVQVLKDSVPVSLLTVDPTDKNITLGEVKTQLNQHTSCSFTGKNKVITVPEDGRYTFRAIMVAADTTSLVLNTAELVLKQ